jgi:hypothetical protein
VSKFKRSVMAAVAIGAAGAGALGTVPASAGTAALPVVFSATGSGSSVHWNSAGTIVLTTVSQPATDEVTVSLSALGDSYLPQTPPSFTASSYFNGNPKWVIDLANGKLIIGFPAQYDSGANSSFTGDQWAVDGTLGSYQQALSDAGDASGDVQVVFARIEDDGEPGKTVSDTVSKMQYDGETAAPGTAVTAAQARAVSTGQPIRG